MVPEGEEVDVAVAVVVGVAEEDDGAGVVLEAVGEGVDELDVVLVPLGVLDPDGLGVGLGEDDAAWPRSGSMTRGLGAGTLPGASRVTTTAVATPARPSPPAAAVTLRALPPRWNSVRRRALSSAGSAACWAAREFTGAAA